MKIKPVIVFDESMLRSIKRCAEAVAKSAPAIERARQARDTGGLMRVRWRGRM